MADEFWKEDAPAQGAGQQDEFWKEDAIAETPKQKGALAQYFDLAKDAGKELQDIKSGKEKQGALGPVTETVVNAATGMGSTAYGGLKGLYKLATGGTPEDATQAIQQAQEDYTYQPRSATGKLLTRLLGAPVEAVTHFAGGAGEETGRLIGGEKGAAAGRAIGETVAQAVPVLMGAKSTIKGGGVSKRTPAAVQQPLPKFGDIKRELTPEQQARLERQQRQGVEPTLASIDREPFQFRFEEQKAGTEAGAPLLTRKLDQNSQFSDALKVLKSEENRSKSLQEPATSAMIRNDVELAKAKEKAKIDNKYEQARAAGETKQLVDISPLESFLSSKSAEARSVPELVTVTEKLNELKRKRPQGTVRPEYGYSGKAEKRGISIDDIEVVRQSANALMGIDSKANGFLREIKGVIDGITEGAGGNLYKSARKAYFNFERTFNDQPSLSALTKKSDFSGNTYKLPTEEVFDKTILRAPLEDTQATFQHLSKSSKQAVQDQLIEHIHTQTFGKRDIEGIEGTNKRGETPFSPDALEAALNKIGAEKLRLILGKQKTTQLLDLASTAKELKSVPQRVTGSDTYQNIENALESIGKAGAIKAISSVPVLGAIAGKPATALLDMYGQMKEKKLIQERINESLNPQFAPHKEVAKAAKEVKALNKQNVRQRNKEMLRGYLKAAAPASLTTTYQANGQRDD